MNELIERLNNALTTLNLRSLNLSKNISDFSACHEMFVVRQWFGLPTLLILK